MVQVSCQISSNEYVVDLSAHGSIDINVTPAGSVAVESASWSAVKALFQPFQYLPPSWNITSVVYYQ